MNVGHGNRYLAGAIWPLLTLVLVEATLAVWLCQSGRVPRSHDGFQYFSLQYYFLNDAVQTGDAFALWMPYMTHGTVSNWWYVSSAGLLQQVYLLFGPVFGSSGFLPLFHLGIWFDMAVLVLGTWLLASRLFERPASAFLACLMVTASTSWAAQPWWSLHFFYALPLLLYLIHLTIDTGKARYLGATGILLALQAMGSLPYFLPVVTLVTSVYGLSVFLVKPAAWHRPSLWPMLRWAGAVMAVAAPLAAVYVITAEGASEIVNHNWGRGTNSVGYPVDLMSYAGNTGIGAWLHLVTGVPLTLDLSRYAGAALVPLAIVGIIRPRREHVPFVVTLVVTLFFSLGTPVADFFFRVWPMMRFFRHLSLAGVFPLLMLCFVAVAGFERLMNRSAGRSAHVAAATSLGITLALWVWSTVGFDVFFTNYPGTVFYGNVDPAVGPIHPGLPGLRDTFDPLVSRTLLFRSALASLGISACLAYLVNRSAPHKWAWFALVVFVGADVGSFRLTMVRMHTAVLDEEGLAALEFDPIPYRTRRYLATPAEHDARLTSFPLSRLAAVPDPQGRWGAQYWSLDSFTHLDQAGCVLRVDHWLAPLDAFLRAFGPQPQDSFAVDPPGFVPYGGLRFPGHPQALDKAGVTSDKVRFHSLARWYATDEEVAAALPGGNVDDLYLVGTSSDDPTEAAATKPDLDYQVLGFSANRVQFRILEVPEEGVWMVYADVWHPSWRATVNGVEVPIYRADLAYKAVRLMPGTNDVSFRISNPRLTVAIRGMQTLTLGFVLAVLAYLLRFVWIVALFFRSKFIIGHGEAT